MDKVDILHIAYAYIRFGDCPPSAIKEEYYADQETIDLCRNWHAICDLAKKIEIEADRAIVEAAYKRIPQEYLDSIDVTNQRKSDVIEKYYFYKENLD